MDWPSKFVGFSAKSYCDAFVDEGLILKSSKGNLRLFKLNSDDYAVREIMKAYDLLKLKHLGIERLAEGCTSLAIYGSFAWGDIDELSDLDLLVIGEDSSVDRDKVLNSRIHWIKRDPANPAAVLQMGNHEKGR